jgi:hypothetical protein
MAAFYLLLLLPLLLTRAFGLSETRFSGVPILFLVFEDEDQFKDENFGFNLLTDIGRTFARRLVVEPLWTADIMDEGFKVTEEQWFTFFNEIGQPEMTQKISQMRKKWKGKEAKLLAETKKQYGKAPDPEKFATVENNRTQIMHERTVLIRSAFSIPKKSLPTALLISPPDDTEAPSICSNESWCAPDVLRSTGMDSAEYHINVSNSYFHKISKGEIKGMKFNFLALEPKAVTNTGSTIQGSGVRVKPKEVLKFVEDIVLPPSEGTSNLLQAVGLESHEQELSNIEQTGWPSVEIKTFDDWEQQCLAEYSRSVICVLLTAPAPIGKTKKRLTASASAWQIQNHWSVLTGLSKLFKPVQRTFKFMWLDTIKFAKKNDGRFPVPLARMPFSSRNTTKGATFPYGCPYLWMLDTNKIDAGVQVLPDFREASQDNFSRIVNGGLQAGADVWSAQEALGSGRNVEFVDQWLEAVDRPHKPYDQEKPQRHTAVTIDSFVFEAGGASAHSEL